MKQESNKRLYFTNDFSPENVAELQAQGYTLRKASAYHEADTLEACAEVAGDVPQAYLDLIKRNKANIVTANVQVSITPELQKVIDDAKAECEKVVAENAELQNKVLIAEKTLVSADEEIKALKDRITYLQEPLASGGASAGTPAEAKPKKPTAAELKAAKAAEDAAQANETQE